jgi:hypothetical protein
MIIQKEKENNKDIHKKQFVLLMRIRNYYENNMKNIMKIIDYFFKTKVNRIGLKSWL